MTPSRCLLACVGLLCHAGCVPRPPATDGGLDAEPLESGRGDGDSMRDAPSLADVLVDDAPAALDVPLRPDTPTTDGPLVDGDSCSPWECGDGTCSAQESCASCRRDCGACPCGDGRCDPTETCLLCAPDCGACPPCGDGICDLALGESCSICAGDCDCACDDGRCARTELEVCPPFMDCPAIPDFCGNWLCEAGLAEDCLTCPWDCCGC